MRLEKHITVLIFCGCVLVFCGFLPVQLLQAQPGGEDASGGGTYFVEPGIRSEFQLAAAHVQCKIGHSVLPDGTTLQMLMASLGVEAVTIDGAAKTVLLSGTMVSIVRLRFADRTSATLTESVPFVAYAEDNGSPGAGTDFFSLTVEYTPTPGLDQADLFGVHPTFAGTLETGEVKVR